MVHHGSGERGCEEGRREEGEEGTGSGGCGGRERSRGGTSSGGGGGELRGVGRREME